MRPITVTVGPLAAASATNIAASQTPVSGTALTLVSNPVVLDTPRRVLLTTGSEAAQRTMLLTGTNWSGSTISETLTVPATTVGTVASVLDYKTVTSLVPAGGGYSAAVTVGTNGVAASSWVRLDEWAMPMTTIQCVVNGTVSYDVQETLDDPNSLTNPVPPALVTWSPSADTAGVIGATATKLSSFAYAPIYARVLLNSGTGTVTATFVQSLVTPA
jgi:hypothetical protein